MNTPAPQSEAAGTQRYRKLPTSQLRAGTTLSSAVLDLRGSRSVLLVAEGSVITTGLISQLKRRGITEVHVGQRDFDQMQGGADSSPAAGNQARRKQRRSTFQPSEQDQSDSYGVHEESYVHNLHEPGAVSYIDSDKREFLTRMHSSVDLVGDFFEELRKGAAWNEPDDISLESLTELTRDIDLFAALGVNPAEGQYPQKHCVQVSMLAMSVGTTMGLTQQELLELGTGCLLHDAGMLLTRNSLWEKDRNLSELEFLEITKHPGLAYDRLRERADVSTGTRMVVYQMHERWNGSGYPRQRVGRQIHHLARISSVADTFVAMVSPRPHRRAMLPYQAMEKIIHGARDGLYDPDVVRGLLHTVSLFPITSFVVTSDGRVGKVIRTNGDLYTQPVLDVWDPGDMDKPPEPVDLSEQTDLEVTRVLTEFEVQELGLRE
ncbi:MAG: HD domain-containing protein [Planctomycetaceae bacterium]|nr:HD domain-containing protein [Planctomycetaceae bacterium]